MEVSGGNEADAFSLLGEDETAGLWGSDRDGGDEAGGMIAGDRAKGGDHGVAGGHTVVDDHDLATGESRAAGNGVAGLAAEQFGAFAFEDLFHFGGGEPGVGKRDGVDDDAAVLGDGSKGEFGLVGGGELANDERINGNAEAIGDGAGNGDAAAG